MSRAAAETGIVRDGMELLRWRYDPGAPTERGRFGWYMQTVGLHVQTLTGSVFGILFAPIAFIAGGPVVGVAVTGALALATWGIGKGLGNDGTRRPHRVVFTSTGVLLGDVGWLWRGSRIGELRKVGFEGKAPGPVRLVFRFRGRGRTRELVLPCPVGSESDARELAELLSAKTSRGHADPREHPRPSLKQ